MNSTIFIKLTYYLAIMTAAIEMLMGDTGVSGSRKPEIMSDAAYAVLNKTSKEITGQFLIDDDVLREEGITDFEPYANVPGKDYRSRDTYRRSSVDNETAIPLG